MRKEGGRRERHMMSVQPVASVSPAEGCTFLEHKSCVYWEHLAADKPYACSTGRPERPGGRRQAILLSIMVLETQWGKWGDSFECKTRNWGG